MGLIKIAKEIGSTALGAGTGALSQTVYSTMFKEYLVSGDMSNGILMKRAEKVITSTSKNTKSDDNLISNGSGIDVQPNQCMIIVENGKIVDYCAEPGRYKYDSSSQPTLIGGGQPWSENFKAVIKEGLSQWHAGGQRFSTQRVYFINMCELIETPIKWGMGDIAFHHTTIMRNGAPPIELDITLKGNGQVTMRVADPIKFFNNIGAQKIGGDNNGVISIADSNGGRDEGILSNLKSGIRDKLGEALSILGFENPIPYTAIRAHSSKVSEYINRLLSNEWAGLRGFEVCTFTINGSFTPIDEDKERLQDMQTSFTMGANLNAANYDVQKTMARGFEKAGENGGVTGIMGMGMSMGQMGGFGQMQNVQPYQQIPNQQVNYQQPMNNQPMYPNQQSQQVTTPVEEVIPEGVIIAEATWICACGHENTGKFCANCGEKKPEEKPANSWTCNCGTVNTGNFCANCGTKKPEEKPVEDLSWTCDCGSANTGKFCPNCGNKKPEKKKILVCDKCGWKAEEGQIVKFCPECGDIVTETDFQ